MTEPWYRGSFVQALFDIGVTDAAPEALSKLNPEDIVETLHKAGVDTLMWYVQCPTGWLFYPSEVGRQHPKLKGRDAVGQCLQACHERDMHFIGYYVPHEMGIEVPAPEVIEENPVHLVSRYGFTNNLQVEIPAAGSVPA